MDLARDAIARQARPNLGLLFTDRDATQLLDLNPEDDDRDDKSYYPNDDPNDDQDYNDDI